MIESPKSRTAFPGQQIINGLWTLLPVLLLFSIAAPTLAQPGQPPARTVLEVSPAAVPSPPLKYRLLPGYGECKPGNAAVYYGKVTAEQTYAYGNKEYLQGRDTLLAMSAHEKMKSPLLDKYANTPGYYMLRAGALCDSCDWQIPLRDQNAMMVPLPEVQQTRTFQRFLILQAIAQIRDRNIDGAFETIQTGFALAHNVGKAPLLINSLVAMAHAAMLREPLELLIEQPEMPSLYWALAWRPHPFTDLRAALEAESDLLLRHMPGFDQLDSPGTDPAFWSGQYALALQSIRDAGQYPRRNVQDSVLKAIAYYPQAKMILVASGMDSSEVDQMPVAKVLLLADKMESAQNAQELACIAAIPWWKASDRQKGSIFQPPATSGLTSVLLAASGQIVRAHVRTERYFNALQTIEAIRHYAATHNGELPDSLDLLIDTPAPDDPSTGKPFQYKRDGNTVFLDSPDMKDGTTLSYEIRFREN